MTDSDDDKEKLGESMQKEKDGNIDLNTEDDETEAFDEDNYEDIASIVRKIQKQQTLFFKLMVEKQNEEKQQSKDASGVEFRKLAELFNNRLKEQQRTLHDDLCSMVYSAIEETNFRTMNTMKQLLDMEKQRSQTLLTAFQSELTEIIDSNLKKMKDGISKQLMMMTTEVNQLGQEMNMLKQDIQTARDENKQQKEVFETQNINHVSSSVDHTNEQKLTDVKETWKGKIQKPGNPNKNSGKKIKYKNLLCFRCQKCGHVMRNCQAILNVNWKGAARKEPISSTVNEIKQLSELDLRFENTLLII